MRKLNFGCGIEIKKGFDNVDIQKSSQVTNSFDFDKFPYPLKKNYYDYILCDNVLEHLKNPERVLNELWKYCKKEAIIEIIVPYYNNKGAFNDMTHLHFFSDTTFKTFVEQSYTINKSKKFEIETLTLIPTNVGKFLPRFLREKFSLFIGGLISQVDVKLKIQKTSNRHSFKKPIIK